MAGGRRDVFLAGIDLGSTSLKAVIYDLAGNPVASGSRPTERFHPDLAHPDWTVWDPAQIWSGAAAAMQEAVTHISDPAGIAAVAVTGMGMDGVPVDGEGRWLYPFISWLCPRTEPQRLWWDKRIGAEKTFAIGGNTLWTHSTALRLLWMAEHEPAILARTREVAAHRGLPELHALRPRGHRLQHGLLHAAVRPGTQDVVAGDAAALRHRRPAPVRSAAQRHGARAK